MGYLAPDLPPADSHEAEYRWQQMSTKERGYIMWFAQFAVEITQGRAERRNT